MTILFFLFLSSLSVSNCHLPVVLWHGMGDSCCNPESLGKLINTIRENMNGTYVKSLRIGSNMVTDVTNSFFMNANDQVKMACDLIANDPELSGGYNAIGISQGGQFLRAVAQRCPIPRIKNLISLGGQHQGVYGIPHCMYPQHKWCDYIRSLLNHGAYWSWVQNEFVQAEYWHDPLHEDEYREKSIFLADINNERVINQSYIDNLAQLRNFVLVKFQADSMVLPVETEWFGFYTPGQNENITYLRDSRIYTEDRLGLQKLDMKNRLKFLAVPGDHLEFTKEWFIDVIMNMYLKD